MPVATQDANIMKLKFCIRKRLCRTIIIFQILLVLLYFSIWFIKHNQIGKTAQTTFKDETTKVSPIMEFTKENLTRKAKLKKLLQCEDKNLVTQLQQQGSYWIMRNLIRGHLSSQMECSESITFTAHGDYTFLGYVKTLVTRWLGPVSLALLAPGYDFNPTMDAIQYIRNCLPESQMIRDYVSFHLYFPYNHTPYQRVPQSEEEALRWPYDCNTIYAPYEGVDHSKMYKTKQNLSYTINVGRNVARKSVNTHFVFNCDLELYPSLDFIEQFLQMFANNVSGVLSREKLRVFPVPIFELQENATLPDSKEQLLKMLKTEMAIPFHAKRCKICHLVPKQDKWIKAKVGNGLKVLTIAKRYASFRAWEPFYVSDNTEPDFDERYTWETQSDKHIQNFAMCLLDYEYHILHPAFLVHAPGIKLKDAKNDARWQYAEEMNQLTADKIVFEYEILYGRNDKCGVH